ncbi:type I-F CRISPR-associated protein Csy3 [Methylomonas sp. SURF-2]|uniref:Type I-F CRISPR-associated protein Csy3 n=1 Tax=Methylomonas subterranea TaxID=2952225 RepID=A0ABT1THA4_9GAMM|nr:type I-F CRISPR-associated protein Csy3 [Methylomonas sp. SURF-2]MCQ8104846.1 type I-F CRISPR-associated protein Csy3 [Methylomonas sp. SURF-2]
MSDAVFKKLPGVLSFQRGIVISDALFYNEIDGQYLPYPVHVLRHGIRGTQNINKTGDAETAMTAEAKRQEVSNIQTTDTSKLEPNAEALIVTFALRFLDFKQALFACAPGPKDSEPEITAVRTSIDNFIERAKTSEGAAEIARRYARNIANARWLWRNRLLAENILVEVFHAESKVAEFNALTIPLHHFDDYSADERQVAELVLQGLRGDSLATLNIVARVSFGVKGAIEVFPSQNYIDWGPNNRDKPSGFSKSLYAVGKPETEDKTTGKRFMGHAALRDQKISNALRTIDTWYPEASLYQGRPIAIEPNGASLEAQRFFRDEKTKSRAFDLVKRLNQLDPASPDGMFVTASLIRGGVYSEAGK